MNARAIIAIVIIAGCLAFAPAAFMSAVVHGAGWGLGREASHVVFGRHR